MSNSTHKVIIVGHLGKDPEMRFAPNGTAVTTFSVASSREYKTKEENVKETTWFRITIWGASAEACNTYLHKSSLVYIEGTLTPGKNGGPDIWIGEKDNAPHANYEVRADVVKFLDSKEDSGGRAKTPPATSSEETAVWDS